MGHGDHAHGSHREHHGHTHGGHRDTPTRRLAIALGLTLAFLAVEVVAGLWTGSLALLSDAAHMATDCGALVIALFAQAIAGRERSGEKTFGYRRAEILAALTNGIILAASSIWIIVEAIGRLGAPPEVAGGAMLIVAAVGLAVNLVAVAVLSGAGRSNPNVRAAATHVVSDAIGSLAAMVAGAAIWLAGWHLVDPIASLVISILILRSGWHLVRDAASVLMEAAPRDLDTRAIEQTIAATPGVAALHDLHVWSISDGFPAVTVHVVLDGVHHGTDVAAAVSQRVRSIHGVEHVTVQPEAPPPHLVPVGRLSERGRG